MDTKNIILYGPPGTGKTYNTVKYAVAIIEEKSIEDIEAETVKDGYDAILKRYKEYKDNKQIAFTTFHQSYGYEEFIEGIKPVLEDDSENVKYTIEPGIFKEFCDRAKNPKLTSKVSKNIISGNPTIWKISLEGARENVTKSECFENGYIRIGWDDEPERVFPETECETDTVRDILIDFQDNLAIGDIVLSLYDMHHIDGIGIVTGEYEYDRSLRSYRRKREVQWLVKNIKENIFELNGKKQLTLRSLYKLNRLSINDIIPIIEKYSSHETVEVEENTKKYVFIIDEINRGNISKIFGELITLIETSKRLGMKEEIKTFLPYSKKEFGVPSNVYILGTMNTADRSIALLDTALRRRFKFIEMLPNSNVLENVNVEGINIKALLDKINKRIEVLYDREHTIGHAYFMSLTDDPTIENLANIFKNSIIPLLQEYFYEDYKKIQLVLGDNNKEEEFKFIRSANIDKNLFGDISSLDMELYETTYEINNSAFDKKESYIKIYSNENM